MGAPSSLNNPGSVWTIASAATIWPGINKQNNLKQFCYGSDWSIRLFGKNYRIEESPVSVLLHNPNVHIQKQERNVYNIPKAVYLTKRWPGWFITRQSVTRCNDLPDWNPFHFVKAQKQYWRSSLLETGQTSQLNVKRSSVKHNANWT